MANVLRQYFPMIRTRKEVEEEIRNDPRLLSVYEKWNREQQRTFLDYCTGQRGVRVLYDAFFKAVINPDRTLGRAEELISLILGQTVKILRVLPLESPQFGDEPPLIVMDVVVELENHSIANLEVQKLGYRFPGQRAACYSSDLLLRQYKRVREERQEQMSRFSYRDIKKVYTIILYEKSPNEFRRFPDTYLHRFAQKSDTGIEIDLLQEYIFISLDNYRDILYNNGIRNKLEAWLAFLSTDEPEMIERLIHEYPQFKVYYEELYTMCKNTEGVMQMFSRELYELDKNTVQLMIDEMQDEINEQKALLSKQQLTLSEKEQILSEKDVLIKKQQAALESQKQQIKELKALLQQHNNK